MERKTLEKLHNFGWKVNDISKISDKQLVKDILECQDINLSEGYRWLDYDTIQELKGLL